MPNTHYPTAVSRVSTGKYRCPDEVIHAALRLLDERDGVEEGDLARECYEASGAPNALRPRAPALADPAYRDRLHAIAARMSEPLRRPVWERSPGG